MEIQLVSDSICRTDIRYATNLIENRKKKLLKFKLLILLCMIKWSPTIYMILTYYCEVEAMINQGIIAIFFKEEYSITIYKM